MTIYVPQSSALGQALSWAGSAVAAAAVLSGVAVLVVALPPPGESQGRMVAPVVLTLAAPEAVAALPTPPPEVSSAAPTAPMLPDVTEMPAQPVAEAAPRLAQVPTLAPLAQPDSPVLPDAAPPPPAPKQVVKSDADRGTQKLAKVKPAKPVAAERPVAASVAGDAGKTAKATRSDGVKASASAAKDAKQRWGSAIRKRVEAQKSYPAAARGAQGTVTVRLTVSGAGKLLGVSVVSSSGHAVLDRAAVKAVQSARFPSAPDGMTEPSASFSLPMKYAN